MPPPGMQGKPVYPGQQPMFLPNQSPPQYAQGPRQPTVRGVAPEEKARSRTTPVALPSPEKLGILPSPDQLGIRPQQAPAPARSVDWNAAQARMKALGVLSYSMEHLPEGVQALRCRDAGHRCGPHLPHRRRCCHGSRSGSRLPRQGGTLGEADSLTLFAACGLAIFPG